MILSISNISFYCLFVCPDNYIAMRILARIRAHGHNRDGHPLVHTANQCQKMRRHSGVIQRTLIKIFSVSGS